MRLYLLFTLLFTSFMFGQLSDKHWLPPLHSRQATNVGEHVVYLSTPSTTPFQVSVTNGNGVPVGTYTISSGSPAQFTVGNAQPSDMFVARAGLHTVSGDDGLILTANDEFYVTFKMRSSAHGEVFVSKGRAGLGTDFRLGSVPQYTGSTDSNRNFVASVMATEANTVVTFSNYDAGVTFTTPTATNSNPTQTFTLQAGQSVVVSGYADVLPNYDGFIGARLTSTKPVAVTTGNITTNPDTGGNDICLDQIVPVERVGMEYVVVKGNGISTTELPIVIATQNNTQIFVNGIATPLATINAGDYYIVPFSYYQGAFNQNMYIETDKPVYLYQVLAGDTQTYTTGLNFIPPLSCSFPKVVDLIPSINAIGTSTAFTSNIIILAVTGSTISINGTPTTAIPQPVLGNPNWVTYRIPGYSGNVKVESTGSTAVGVFGESGTIGYASFYSGFGTVNITYQPGAGTVGLEEDDMTVANGLAVCPGDIRVLDTNLDPNDFDFEWTVDIGDGNGPQVIVGETGPSLTIDSPGTYCVTTSNGFVGSACTQTDCVIVEYLPDFVINDNPNDLYSCGNEFDLSQNTATILNGLDPFQYDVLFYENLQDAIDNINQIPPIQTIVPPVKTFYVRVEDINTTCPKITQFDAIVTNCQATQPSDMIVCDDISEDGVEAFDLTTQDAGVLGGLPAADFTITYHLSQAGADAGNNFATPVTAYIGGPNQVIYVRMESNADPTQYSTTSFNLIVYELPDATISANTVCEGETGTVTITGTPNATVQYTVDSGANQSIVLDASGTAVITTPILTSDSIYCLVDVTSNTTPACTKPLTACATVIVNPLPTATISANTICEGDTGTVTITGTPNATVQYTVDSGANQSIVLDASGTAVITTPILTSNSIYCLVDVTSNSTPACVQTLNVCATVIVNPLPTATISTNAICDGGTGTVTITGTPNATVQYTVDSGANQSIVLDASGTAVITTPILTSDSIYCLVDVTSNTTPACVQTLNVCATVTVNPLPTATISANTVCEGDTGTVTITGTPNATVQYTVDSGANQSIVLDASGTAVITTPVLTSDSTYCLVDVTSNTTPACTQVLNECATVIVNPLPTATISANTICEGETGTVTITGTPNATVQYTIDSGANQSIVLDASGLAIITTPILTSNSIYCLVDVTSNATPACTQVLNQCATVIVNPLPTASIVGDIICEGDTAVVTFTGTPDATVNYTLDGVSQTPVTLSSTGTATVSSTPSTGIYTYCLVDVTSNTTPACTQTLTQCEDVEVLQAPVANPITDIAVCDDNNDGFATFDLTPAIVEAQGGDATLTVTIHETQADADFDSNPVSSPYQNIDPDIQVLYIRVENAGGCYTVIPFNIIVNPRPDLNQNVMDYELCDVNNSPDGIEEFDITNAALTADITNGEPGLTLYYYENQADALANNTANQIPNPATYSNTSSPNQQTIWVTAENAAGCIDTTSFELIVNPLPVLNTLNDMNGCSDGVNPNQAPFNLTLNNPLVIGSPGYTISYYATLADAQVPQNEIISSANNPYIGTDGQVIIVRVENATTGCYNTTTVQLNVTQGPVANTPTPLTYCDPNNDGIGIFNLEDALNDISGGPTPTGVTVTFHETPQDAQLGTNAIDTSVLYNNIVPNQQTIYVSVSYALTGCANYTELQLIVNPTPEIVSPAEPLQECDDAVADGYTQFDLTQIEAEVLNGIDPTTVTITYHETQAAADAGTPIISNILNYTNSSNPQTLYIRVEYTATGCYSVESFELVVNPLPIMPVPEDITMSLCDVNNPGDQIECFDLNSQIPTIVNGQTNMIVTFHFSQADAIAGVSPLTSPYCNTSNAQSIFVRLENGATGCFDTVIMDLRVEPLPVLVTPPPVEECGANQDGFAIFDLTALEQDMLNGASDITLSYYETDVDAQNQTNPIPNPTAYQNIDPFNQIIYVLAVNDVTGCSSITMIELVAHPAPVMPSLDDLIVCDNNYDGYAYFDLTVQNPIILAANTISPLQIRYYTTAVDAANGTSAIVNTANFYGGPNQQTIWVVVTDPATGCSATTTFDLIINIPVDVRGQNNRLTLCDESLPNDQFTTFDLTIMNAQILGSNQGTVTYYLNLADAQSGNNAITNPEAFVNTIAAVQTIYAVVTSAEGCNSITTVTIRVEPLPTPNEGPYDPIEVCDNDQTSIGTEMFDLTVNQTTIQDGYPNLTFTYYANQADYDNGIAIPDPTMYEGPTSTIIIAVQNNRVDFFGENCSVLVYQPIQVNPLPDVVDTTYVICDDDTDGLATFDLSSYNEQLLDTANTGQATADFTVTYYDTQANAQAGTSTGLLPNIYTNGSNPETIYPRVVNNTTGCVNALAEVTLVVKLRAVANPISQAILDTFTKCDYYNANDGVEQFDLTAVEADILGTQTNPPVSITYHLTPQDQATGDNPIANTTAFENTSNPQTIYIRVERANDDPLDTTAECYDVAEITLNVELLAEPVITSPSETICVDFNTGDVITGLVLDSGIPAGTGYSYQWALNGVDITDGTGEGATYTVDTAAPGDYTVVVTSAQGCISSPSPAFTVIQSGPPANIQTYVSGAFEETQTITVVHDGYGEYEYQLEPGGPWQSSPVFTNVPAGVVYYIQIRDVKTQNPCDGDETEAVQIINYPHFFTPNGDGINDNWNIQGLDGQDTAKIYIFDRYGKLIKQISSTGDGWNGTLNGQPLPATDYWFTVDYYEITPNGTIVPKQFKAHFSLKR